MLVKDSSCFYNTLILVKERPHMNQQCLPRYHVPQTDGQNKWLQKVGKQLGIAGGSPSRRMCLYLLSRTNHNHPRNVYTDSTWRQTFSRTNHNCPSPSLGAQRQAIPRRGCAQRTEAWCIGVPKCAGWEPLWCSLCHQILVCSKESLLFYCGFQAVAF